MWWCGTRTRSACMRAQNRCTSTARVSTTATIRRGSRNRISCSDRACPGLDPGMRRREVRNDRLEARVVRAVIPAKAGIPLGLAVAVAIAAAFDPAPKVEMDPSFRWDDDKV